MKKKTRKEIINEKLALRDGWVKYGFEGGIHLWANDELGLDVPSLPDYLASMDWLRRVLLKLTKEEWKALEKRLRSGYVRAMGDMSIFRYALALKPNALATMVARAIKG